MSDSIFNLNYFEIFSQPVTTEPDVNLLKQKNRELQQQAHPDKFANSSDADKRLAMQKTSLINEAFETLKKPVSRLQYMLTLKGVDMNGETDTSMDGAFLMEQMELRESISEVRNQAEPLDVLATMLADLKSKAKNLTIEFSESYELDDLEKSREIVRKLQFISKAEKEVNEIIEQLEDELI
ncbi:MAG: Fe-S protein assembly co-chaperone HscB [Gammaproteobacteria bacterium]|nr:Fe-S protein assembly co-chaperone HscB [Gammaproteobacteria bacterium]